MRKFVIVPFLASSLLSGTILSTADGGASWQREFSGTVGDLNGVAVDIFTGAALAVGDGGRIIRRGDDSIWEDVSLDGFQNDLFSVVMGSGGVCMACGADGALLSSFDGGYSWRVWEGFDSGGADLLTVNFDPTSPDNFVITGENGFVHSASAGREQIDGVTGSCARLCSGEAEALAAPAGSITALVSAGSPCIAVGEEGAVFLFGNNGWARIESGCEEDLNGVTNLVFGETFCAVGEGGAIILSEDNGLSWRVVDSGTAADLNGVAGNGGGIGYIVGDGPFGRYLP
ncbi:MAG TPA: hypothetical protein PKX02_11545 [Candidatus Sabulitectum sp.]|nr:hypothetical protein [Candidatus Sabulitectum sp.]